MASISGFNAKPQRFEPVPYDKENFTRWLALFHLRAKRYGFDDVLRGTRTKPNPLAQPAAIAHDADEAKVLAYETAMNAYIDRLYQVDKI